MSIGHVSFNVSNKDAGVIQDIVQRAANIIANSTGKSADRLALSMDITAAHANGCPLDLPRLLEAESFDFMHDVMGIQRHIDRDTGKLGDCFLPRFAQKARAAA